PLRWIHSLSLHDALPISGDDVPVDPGVVVVDPAAQARPAAQTAVAVAPPGPDGPVGADDERLLGAVGQVPDEFAMRSVGTVAVRSEEHTSELQSLAYLVC